MNAEVEPAAHSDLKRKKVSAFVICYNEEEEIEQCLETLRFCDEVVVIDSYSTDRTVEICESFGAKVIQRDWPGYREQKAFGLASTTYDWVVNIDADERVSKELQASILKILERKWQIEQGELTESAREPDGYEVSRIVYYLGRWWRRGGWYPEYRVRFFFKPKVTWGGVDPHEKPIVDGPIDRIDGELHHFTYRSLDEQLRRLHAHASVAAREEARRGRTAKLSDILFRPLLRMVKFYFVKRGYREGMAGVVVVVMEGFYTFLKYAKLWEHNNAEVRHDDDSTQR